jgi:pimeloyl-ACP methyl ester carboxylesterase
VQRLLIIIGLFIMLNSTAQPITTVYCFPGQGSDRRIFDSLKLDPAFRIEVIEYGTPAKRQSMASFAMELTKRIDTSQPYVLLGHSLGGMLCVEMSEVLKPQMTIIISSAKNRNEFPHRYRFQRVLPVYQIVPGGLMLAGSKLLQPIVEPDRNTHKETFKSMLRSKNATYMRRTVQMIMKWDRTANSKPVCHIHGTNDHTLPIKRIKSPDFIIENGSHMMVLTRAAELSALINRVLKDGTATQPAL